MTGWPSSEATVGGLLRTATEKLRAAGSESARLDAELLLAHVLEVERTTVLAHPEVPVGERHGARLAQLIERRASGEPVAYIRGFKEFFGLAIAVDRRALIPRPETERLVELALDQVRDALTSAPRFAKAGPLRIWDVGTGSGALAIAIAAGLLRKGYGGAFAITATDLSPEALALALENAVAHGLADVIDLRQGDLLATPADTADPAGTAATADLVVANLPYIPTADLAGLPIAASFEPIEALHGGPDGLLLIRRLLAELPTVLSGSGAALLEIGADQAGAALDAAAAALPGWPASVARDLGGRPRVLVLRRP